MVGGKTYILIMASRATVDFYFGIGFSVLVSVFLFLSLSLSASVSVSFCLCLFLPVSIQSIPKVGKVGR